VTTYILVDHYHHFGGKLAMNYQTTDAIFQKTVITILQNSLAFAVTTTKYDHNTAVLPCNPLLTMVLQTMDYKLTLLYFELLRF
jgi:hypothetical protein